MLDKIKELCKKHGISLEELESCTGIGRHTIYRWDATSPSIEKATKVAEYFNVSLDYLAGRSKDSIGELNWILDGMNEQGKEMVLNFSRSLVMQPQYKKCDFNSGVEKSS